MEIFAPEYYNQFRCIASACPDSCCKEWEVDVDAAAAAFYRGYQSSCNEESAYYGKDGLQIQIDEESLSYWNSKLRQRRRLI